MKPFNSLQAAIDWGKTQNAGDFCCYQQWQGFKPPMPIWRLRVSMERETGVIIPLEPATSSSNRNQS